MSTWPQLDYRTRVMLNCNPPLPKFKGDMAALTAHLLLNYMGMSLQANRAALPQLPSQVAALVPRDEVHKAMKALKEVGPASCFCLS